MTNLLYKPLIISHAGCMDGLGALLAAQMILGEGNFDIHLATYGSPVPDVQDRDVYIFDFSYARDVMLSIIEKAKQVSVVDHHATAEETLKDLPCFTLFDKNRSGAVLAYDFLMSVTYPDKKVYEIPQILLFIQDRDLWAWKLPYSAEINEYFRTQLKYDTDDLVQSNLQMLMEIHDRSKRFGWDKYVEIGTDRLRSKSQMVENVLSRRFNVLVELDGEHIEVGVAFGPDKLTSEVGGELAKLMPSGVGMVITGMGMAPKFGMSVRGTKESGDLAKRIAESYGGGGHAQAAGCGLTCHQLSTLLETSTPVV